MANKYTGTYIAKQKMRKEAGLDYDMSVDTMSGNTDDWLSYQAYGSNGTVEKPKAEYQYSEFKPGEGRYQQNIDSTVKSMMNSQPWTDPNTDRKSEIRQNYANAQYDSRYDDVMQGLLDKIMNGGKFDYDINGDTTFQTYKNTAERSARMAAEDALARANAASGGYGNTYSQAMANQQYNAEMQRVADVVPELEDRAYTRWQNDKNDTMNQYSLAADADSRDYARWNDSLNRGLNEYSMLDNESQQDYQRYNDTYSRQANLASLLEGMNADEYNRLMTTYQANEAGKQAAVESNRWNTQFDYQRQQDAIANNRASALSAAELGEYEPLQSFLAGQGFNVDFSDKKQWDEISKGMQLFSATGITSWLKNAGLDTSRLESQLANEDFANKLSIAAAVFEASGDDSYLRQLGLDTSYVDQIQQYTLAQAANAAYSSSGGGSGSRSSSGGSSSSSNSGYYVDNETADDDEESGEDKTINQLVSDYFDENKIPDAAKGLIMTRDEWVRHHPNESGRGYLDYVDEALEGLKKKGLI